MPREKPSRPVDVLVDLIVQLEGRAELSLAPQQLMKIQPHDIAVDVGIEVEDVALDRHSIVFEQRRPHADVRDALKRTGEALEAGRGHVDAAAWIELVRRIDVDGRKSD